MRCFLMALTAATGFLCMAGSVLRAETSSNRGNDHLDKPNMLSRTDVIWRWPHPINPVHVALVFSRFKGEAPSDSLAPSWASELFNGEVGSIDHFFDVTLISHDIQMKITIDSIDIFTKKVKK